MTDETEIPELHQKISDLEQWLAAERERREAVEERLCDARDELRRQQAEMVEMQKVNSQLRGKIAELETKAMKRAKRSERMPRQ